MAAIDLPSARELELEALVRQRDAKLAHLTDEISILRNFLSSQPGPSTSDPVALPPSLVTLLLPHITSSSDTSPPSGTVAAALTQRALLLQEENDELYEILKHGETGRLKEEVRGLRRVVDRLEKALRQSHQVIESLSTELEKSYTLLLTSTRQTNSTTSTKTNSHSPRHSYYSAHRATSTGNGSHGSKIPPTGPRAYKKPRLSEPRVSSPSRSSQSHHSQAAPREYASRQHHEYRGKGQHAKMDVDDEQRRTPTPVHNRDRERERERGPKERERDRDREGRFSRRNFAGGSGRGGGSGGRRTDRNAAATNFAADRTLAERLGL